MRNFKKINGDYDFSVYQRTFSGRITKDRYKKLQRFARKNTFSNNCGCEYDCCGHLCSKGMSINYSKNQVIITLSESYNY